MFLHQNHGTEEGNGSIMVGMFVCLCLASKKSSGREFLVPARTDFGVKLLRNKVKLILPRLFTPFQESISIGPVAIHQTASQVGLKRLGQCCLSL